MIVSALNVIDLHRLDFVKILSVPFGSQHSQNAMRQAGLEFYQQYPACGRFLDFALFKNNLKLDVEVDGETYHRSGSGDGSPTTSDEIRR